MVLFELKCFRSFTLMAWLAEIPWLFLSLYYMYFILGLVSFIIIGFGIFLSAFRFCCRSGFRLLQISMDCPWRDIRSYLTLEPQKILNIKYYENLRDFAWLINPSLGEKNAPAKSSVLSMSGNRRLSSGTVRTSAGQPAACCRAITGDIARRRSSG